MNYFSLALELFLDIPISSPPNTAIRSNRITGEQSHENGLLVIDLNCEVPEALKPCKIEIVTTQDSGVRSIGHQDAA